MANTLISTSDLQTCCCNDSILTINDDGVGINIKPFLGCKITPNRQCRPIPFVEPLVRRFGTVVTPWNKYAEPFGDIDERILTEASYFLCANSGMTKVNIADPGQDDVRVGDEICDNEFDAFVEAADAAFGPLSAEQLANIEVVIDSFTEFGDGDVNKLAYILTTVRKESGFYPIRERTRFWVGETNISDAQAIARLGNAAYARVDPQTGQAYYGRGFVQITWKTNYQKMSDWLSVEYGTEIDLVNNPDLVLANPEYAAAITVYGMMEGIFPGNGIGLDHYINSGNANNPDFKGARRTVNGQDDAEEIARDTRSLLSKYDELIEDAAQEAEDPTDELADINPWDRKLHNMRPKEKLIAVEGAVIVCPNALIPPPMFY